MTPTIEIFPLKKMFFQIFFFQKSKLLEYFGLILCPNFLFLSAYGHHLLKNNFIETKTPKIARDIKTNSESIDILISNQNYNENF